MSNEENKMSNINKQEYRFTCCISWNDNNDEGDFLWSGKAYDEEDAEFRARTEMAISENAIPFEDTENTDAEVEQNNEKLEKLIHDKIMNTGGSVIYMMPGAVGHAHELEMSLIKLLEAVDKHINNGAKIPEDVINNARKTLKNID